MRLCRVAGVLVAVGILTCGAVPAFAQAEPFEPEVGQPGKDVVWVPTPQLLVNTMLDLADVTPDDYLVDLGSGDGRTVITAASRGLRAHGVEYNPDMVSLSRRNAREAGVADRATFEAADIFETDFSDATVVTLFLLPSLNVKLRPTLLEMEPGTRVVSNTFTMGDWEPDASERLEEDCSSWCTALLWIVPAQVEGPWELGGRTLQLDQTYQMLSGTLGDEPIEGGRLLGDEISFTVSGRAYVGQVDGATMTGTVDNGASWSATRAEP